MIRNRLLLKSFAVFFIIEMLASTVAPTISWALTAGPTAPEASSFEPVDTSEMVDLTTGDMVYNLPLLEVPGPAGSYPVSISYHAGINPAADASWVGLGWNINTGSILRSTSGYPDDWKEVNSKNSESWEGGVTHRVSKGLSLSYWGLSLSAGVIKTNDTYKGSQKGGYTSLSYGWSMGNSGVGASAGFSASDDPASGSSLSVGGGISYGKSLGGSAASGSVGLGVNSVFTAGGSSSSVGLSGGISVRPNNYVSGSASVLGASISSNGSSSVSVSGIGFNSGHMKNSGKVQTETNSNLSKGQQAAIHFGTGSLFDYSDDYIKYFIDEVDTSSVNGALYPIPSGMDLSYFDKRDYDVYDMVEVANGAESSENINSPKFGVGNEIMMGGTLPATDNYMVMGQGTGGSIKPYDLLGTLYRQNKKNKYDKYITKQYVGELGTLPQNAGRSEFMFMNEFSNSYLYDNSGAGEYFSTLSSSRLKLDFNPQKVLTGSAFSGDKTINNKLARASNIVWYSNKEIVENDKNNIKDGLVRPNAKGFLRNEVENYNDQVGAIRITNPSGVTYHYALPAYTYNEVYHTENMAYDLNKEGAFKTIVYRKEKYAYTWYLTAVTGPDYVDRGENGVADGVLNKYDWGYWTEFEYGKWASDYKWRTPETGFVEDMDGNFQNYSSGQKELYYLNAIRSATHTALFVKDIRRDGKGLASNGREASFVPVACNSYPTSTLKLTKIILIENDHLPAIDYSYNNSFLPVACTREIPMDDPDTEEFEAPIIEQYEIDTHHGGNVLLSENITQDQMDELEMNSIKRIVFDTDDTQMMPNTPNSFSSENLYTSNPVVSNARFGKLELKGIQVYGRGSDSLIPSIKFDYKNKATPYNKDKTDYWGFYKSDYDANIKDSNIRKEPTDQSALEVDTWSLNKIVTSLGAVIHIDYESDDYERSVLHNKVNFKVTNMTTEGDGTYKIFIGDLNGKLDKYFDEGEAVSSLLAISQAKKHIIQFDKTIFNPLGGPRIKTGTCDPIVYFKLENVLPYYNNAIIRDINYDHLVLEVPQAEKIIHKVPYHPAPDHNNINDLEAFETFYALASSSNPEQNAHDYCKPTEENIEHFKDFIGGELYAEIKENKKGGGLRVKEISIIEPVSNLAYVTSYDYANPNTGKSSGVTTYVPFKINTFTLDYPEHYENAVEGYFKDGNLRDGGFVADVIKNWQEITRTLLLGPSLEHFLDYFDLIDHPDRETMAAFLGLGLNTANETVEHRRTELMSELLYKVNEVPSASVMYEYVTVKNKVVRNGATTDNQSYVVNQFIVYDPSMVSIKADRQKLTTNLNTNDIRNLVKRGVTINNFGNAVGQIKSSRIHALDGTLLSEKVYHYLHELNNSSDDVLDNYATKLNDYNSQGMLDETYVNARYIPYDNDMIDYEEQGPGDDPVEEEEVFRHDLLGIMTKRRNLPMILLSVENWNYKTGITSTDKTLAFDFYSGSVTKNIATDGYGNTYLSEVIPAYTLTQYGNMGLAINGGKNMLSQETASYSYKVSAADYNTKLGLVSASIQTWSNQIPALEPGSAIQTAANQPDIWRKHASFSFIGDDNIALNSDGLYPISSVTQFNAWNRGDVAPVTWQKNSEVTLYDVQSHALEAADLNGLYATTRMTPDQTRVTATAANSRFSDFNYTGVEGFSPSDIDLGNQFKLSDDAVVVTGNAHTGSKSVRTEFGSIIYENDVTPNKKYILSFWATSPDAVQIQWMYLGNPQDLTSSVVRKAGNWYQYNVSFFSKPSHVKIWCKRFVEGASGVVYFDDFRISPSDASMNSYVYNQWGELTHILDNNNLYTEYVYDGMGRLKEVHKETFQYEKTKVSEAKYHYANQN